MGISNFCVLLKVNLQHFKLHITTKMWHLIYFIWIDFDFVQVVLQWESQKWWETWKWCLPFSHAGQEHPFPLLLLASTGVLILGAHGNTFVCKHIKSRDLFFTPSLVQALVACLFLDIIYLFTVMAVSIKVFPSATK